MKLVLFCGGPAIYGNGVPKPLTVLTDGETLLDLYSKSDVFRKASSVDLLVEREFEYAFTQESDKLGPKVRVRVSENFSSTGLKLKQFCEESSEPEALTLFSYPDVFFFGDLGSDFSTDADKIWLSSRSVLSRFPRFFPEPYGSRLLSISGPSEKEGSNRVLMFGGHIIAKPSILGPELESWFRTTYTKGEILEEQGFSHFVRSGLAAHFELLGSWFQADSSRDVVRITSHIAGPRQK